MRRRRTDAPLENPDRHRIGRLSIDDEGDRQISLPAQTAGDLEIDLVETGKVLLSAGKLGSDLQRPDPDRYRRERRSPTNSRPKESEKDPVTLRSKIDGARDEPLFRGIEESHLFDGLHLVADANGEGGRDIPSA